VVSLFMLGACGDINHCDFVGGTRPGKDLYVKMGKALAEEVIRVGQQIELKEAVQIDCRRAFLPMNLRKPSQQELDESELVLSDPTSTTVQRFFADHIRKVALLPDETVQVEIQAFRMLDWAVVGLPGEIFVELGLSLK